MKTNTFVKVLKTVWSSGIESSRQELLIGLKSITLTTRYAGGGECWGIDDGTQFLSSVSGFNITYLGLNILSPFVRSNN